MLINSQQRRLVTSYYLLSANVNSQEATESKTPDALSSLINSYLQLSSARNAINRHTTTRSGVGIMSKAKSCVVN